ncbi:MAG: cell division protein FtsI, partial [Nonomuraea sp.]|nr:cell division protein FtsI [Nonomuraea sp.]
LSAAKPRKLEASVVRALRDLMPAVISEGTAHAVRFPAGTAGKTGTAEYGSGKEPPTHSWFIGYRGDLAFAVIVEGGGTGAAVAAPVSARFLSGLAVDR